MAFASPEILRQIFARRDDAPNGPGLWQMIAQAGAGMSQAAAQPGANFGQALGGGAAGMAAGQQAAIQGEAQRLQMQRLRRQQEMDEARQAIWRDILGSQGQVPQDTMSTGSITPQPQQQRAPVGSVAREFESGAGGIGTISTGLDDPGGASYGPFQLSSEAGTLNAFLQSPEGRPFAQPFAGLQPGTEPFNEAYRQVARQTGQDFDRAQHQFISRTHVQPVMEVAQQVGIDTSNPAVQEALFSQGVQHSGEGNVQILRDAATKLGPGAGPREVVDALYDARGRYASQFVGPEASTQRYQREKQRVLELVDQPAGGAPGAPMQQGGQPGQGQQPQRDTSFIGGLPAETRALLALMGPEQGAQALFELQQDQAGGGVTTATQTRLEAVQALREADPSLTEAQARNAVFGRYTVSRDPISGEAQVIDKVTGERVNQVKPETVERTDADRELVSTIVPEGMDIAPGMGGSGFLSNIVNTAADMVNMDLPFPEAEAAKQAVDNLKTQTMTALAQEVAGRPSNFLLEQFQRIAPESGSLLQGDARSREKLRTTSALIDEKLRMVDDVVNNPGQYRPATVDAARQNKLQLEALKRQYDTAYENFGTGGQGGSRSGGGGVAPGVSEFTQDRAGPSTPVPQGWDASDWRWLTEEERQQVLRERGNGN